MRRRVATRRRAAPLLMAGCALVCAGTFASSTSAQEMTGEVAVSLGGEVVSNPYLEDNDPGTSVAGTAEIRPRLSYDNSVTRLDVQGFAQGSAYADNYGFEDNYGASAALSQRMSERLTLSFNAGLLSTESPPNGELWSTGGPGSGAAPGQPQLPQLPNDPTVFGQHGRSTTASFGTGVQYIADARNQIAIDGSYSTTSLTYPGASDYDTAGVEGNYTHVIDERTNVGLIAGYRSFSYEDPLSPDGRTLSLLGSLSILLDPAWTLTGAAGVERTRMEKTATAPSSSSTSFSARASLCRRDERENFCVDYNREAQPSAFAGIRNTDRVGMSYSRQLTAVDTLTMGASYSRNGGYDSGPASFPATTFLGTRAGVDHRFNERLSGYVEGSVDKLRRTGFSVEPRLSIGAGIRYVFGRRG